MPQLIKTSNIHEENVHIETITMYSNGMVLDITTVFDSIVIEEDIEGGFSRGTIRFIDSFTGYDFSFSGLELLDVSFTSVDKDFKPVKFYKKRFRVVHYEAQRAPATGRYDAVIMHFVSNASVENDSIKLTKSYNTSYSNFVKECCGILGYEDDQLNIEETIHVNHFIAPHVTPLDMINWTKLVAMSKETNSSDFYFFENRDGINYKSLEAMKAVKPNKDTHTLYYKPNVGAGEISYNLILEYSKPKGYNIRDDIRYGGIGATVATHDLITKDYKEYVFSPDMIKPLNVVEAKPDEYERNYDAYTQFWSHNNAYATMDVNSVTHSAVMRSVSKTKINYKCMNLTIPGNVDIKSGDVVLLSVSALRPDENGSGVVRFDESGKWLVKKVRHVLTKHKFNTDLEVVTDGNINEIVK